MSVTSYNVSLEHASPLDRRAHSHLRGSFEDAVAEADRLLHDVLADPETSAAIIGGGGCSWRVTVTGGTTHVEPEQGEAMGTCGTCRATGNGAWWRPHRGPVAMVDHDGMDYPHDSIVWVCPSCGQHHRRIPRPITPDTGKADGANMNTTNEGGQQ